MSRRSLYLTFIGLVWAGCGAPTDVAEQSSELRGPAVNLASLVHASAVAPPAFDWSRFPDDQQCIAGVDIYYQSVYGIRVNPALCQFGNNGTCASCGACLVWVDNLPDSTLFNRYAWGTKTPQPEDVLIFPPVSGNPYGHAALFDHADASGTYVMDDNWWNDTRKASCPVGACGSPHNIGNYKPFGFYRLKSHDCGGPICGSRCCPSGAWCGQGNRCCTGCGAGCPC
jgi:hypothetical protein